MNRETIRKQKNEEMGQNDNENNNKVLDGTVQPSLKLSVGIEPEVEPLYARSSISHEMGEKDEKKFSVLEIDDTAHALQQNVGTPSQGDFVAEVAGLISTGVNETCPTSEEQSGLSNGVDNGLIKKRGGYTEVCDVPESREVETSKWRKKSHHTNGKKFSDLGDISQPVEDKVDNDTSSPCLVVENTSVSLDNKFEKTCSRIGVVSEQVTDILTEKDSDNHLDNSSDILKLDSVKIDITREEAPPSTNNGQVEDLVHLDATVNKGDSSQMPNTLPERSLVVRSKKKLLILDVNGILVEFVSQVPRQYRPHIRISKKGVFKRPYCDDFLQFCFERFNVAVWSSRMKINVDKVVNFLFDQTRDKLLFCWDQSHCTPTGLNTLENNSKPLVLKELRKVWEKVEPDLPFERGEYDETNTLLLDDSPYKALRNPANTAVFPFPYRFENRRDNSLGPGGDLRTYLEGLSMADNVKEYVEQNPFGQGAITKLHKQWNFYCNIVAAADEPVAAK
ncbi:hypothetical protein TIFTF001_023443 [Ficus carica]|uniref:Mitochondrial import inner membrane translocase subunit TIM50 n=1 Tax=Ficus carica TaxID=3494 RepID=A0AA88DCF5_FICCA|nr:hypothetical protein TIFTF001_023443 [Ficus carica]